jgi:glycosyltransferase involved in cell wall biosynthesis
VTRVSVLLPIYNGAAYLDAAIESLLAQTVRDFELLIIDDGSTDGTLDIVKRHAASDSRIRFSSRPNRGLVDTLNELLSMASAPFIARMDADDIALPERFDRQLREFSLDPDLLAVGSDIYSIDPEGRRLMTIVMPHSHEEIDEFTMAVVHGSGMCHPSMMFRAVAFSIAGQYRAEYWPAEDADLILRIAEKGKVSNIPLPLLCYRVHDDSIGHTQAVRQREALYAAAAAAAERRGAPAPDPRLRALSSEQRHAIESPAAREVKWAWWALGSGNVRAARSLALRAVLKRPLVRDAWVVLACAIRGR